MTTFVIAAGLMLAVVLLWLLRPLLHAPMRGGAKMGSDAQTSNIAVYRAQLAELEAEFSSGVLDAVRYEDGKRALMQRLALDTHDAGDESAAVAERAPRVIALVLGVAVPLAAIALYWRLGNIQALDLDAKDAAVQREAAQMTPEKIDAMVHKLEDYLKRNPNDGKGWSVLARTYRSMGKSAQAQAAFERAIALLPQDAQLKTDFAELLAMLAQGDLRGQASALIEESLKLDGNNPDTLVLAGSAAAQRGDGAAAIKHWEKLLALLPPEAEVRAAVQQGIDDLRKRGGQPLAQKGSVSISVKVSLSPGLTAKVDPGDTLFVFARAAQGPKMPLAVVKAKPSELPHAYTLSDANAMTPDMAISKFDQILVGARVSKSGSPMAQSGDLEGLSVAFKPGAANTIEIVIDRVVP